MLNKSSAQICPAYLSKWRLFLLQFLLLLAAVGCASSSSYADNRDNSASPSDLPARVGRISLISGAVTLNDLHSSDSEAASLNWPITSGHRLSTGRLARAEVRIGSLAVRLDGDTDVDFQRVDDELIQLIIQRGSVALRARQRELAREVDLLTPRERILLDDAGRYRIDVDQAADVTAVTAYVGTARVSGNRMTFAVQSGQRGESIAGLQGGFHLVTPAADVFDDWVATRDRRDDTLASTQYVSAETTGVEALDEHGYWRTVPSYGTVWFPASVPSGWAPYRYGRWAHVAPWGWTWIDDAPWGFAPFHYGRWVYVGNVWAWAPGTYIARPVYSPALVAWYGTPGASISVQVGQPVGWFPLGWGEPYVPPYYCSPRYVRRINVPYVTNVDYIGQRPLPRYSHQAPGSSTWAPSDALVRSQPIQRVVQRPSTEQLKLPAAAVMPIAMPSSKGGFSRPADQNSVQVNRPNGNRFSDDSGRVPGFRAVPPAQPLPTQGPSTNHVVSPTPPPRTKLPAADANAVRPPATFIPNERGNERSKERDNERFNDRLNERSKERLDERFPAGPKIEQPRVIPPAKMVAPGVVQPLPQQAPTAIERSIPAPRVLPPSVQPAPRAPAVQVAPPRAEAPHVRPPSAPQPMMKEPRAVAAPGPQMAPPRNAPSAPAQVGRMPAPREAGPATMNRQAN